MPKGKQRQKDRNKVISEEMISETYDAVRFTVADGLSDYDTKTNEADMFSNLLVYSDFQISADEDITLKYNSTGNPARVLECGQLLSSSVIQLTDLYISNSSGNTATIDFYGTQKGA